jgi:hypothetical protein
VRSDYTYGQGYIEAGSNGGVYAYGNAQFHGSTESINGGETAQQWFGEPIVGTAVTGGGAGYWIASSNAAVCGFGTAQAYYYQGGTYGSGWCWQSYPVYDVVGMAADPANGGYWLVGADGGIYAFGGAPYLGNAVGDLNGTTGPIVAMASTPDGGGYWLVTSNGYIYAPRYNGAGDSQYEGSMGGTALNCAIVGMAAAQNDSSYWMDGCDGGVFSFGGAQAYGSLAQTAKYFNIEAMAPTADGYGFYLMAFDGSVLTYGDAQFQGDIYGNNEFGYGEIAGIAHT